MPPGITQERAAQVLANEPAGAYRRLVLSAPAVAAAARPGQFVACAIGRPDGRGALLLRRAFSLHRADPVAGTIEVVVADHAPGTHWVATRRPGDTIDIVGPAGRGFPLGVDGETAGVASAALATGAVETVGSHGVPSDGLTPEAAGSSAGTSRPAAILVGGGYGSAPLFWLAEQLRARGVRADLVLGAATADRLFLPEDSADGVPPGVHLVTEDGSRGRTGRVTDLLAAVVAAHRADRRRTMTIYACGPMAMLRAVDVAGRPMGISTQLAVEESMACGIGVCMTCVLPIVNDDGVTRMTRSCIDGPVFGGDRLRWDAIDIVRGKASSRVPDDCYGAPLPIGGGH